MRPTDRDDTRDEGLTTVSLANIASEQNSLTLAHRLAILHAMSGGFWAVAALRSVLSTRRDLLLESLALRHQLGVRSSDRRFRPSDRLLWVLLRRLWPRWGAALLLVQPATVARWHREGVSWMLAPSLAAAGKTMHRFTTSLS